MCQFHACNLGIAAVALTKLRRFCNALADVRCGAILDGSHAAGDALLLTVTVRLFPLRYAVILSRLFCICVALVVAAAAAQGPTAAEPTAKSALPDRVVNLLREANFPQDALGVVVLRASDGMPVLEHRANEAMQPASTLKTLTSIVALERLGPSYRGKTELRSVADLKAGTLSGDVVLRGLGSPDFDWRALQRMLQTLRFSGVTTIEGDVILDRTYFQPSRPDVGVPAFDETPEFAYNVIPDALSLNSNLLQLEIASDEATVRVGVTPMLDRVTVDSDMKVVDKPCADWEDFWKLPEVKKADDGRIRVTLKGEFPRNCPLTTEISVLDRVDYADRLFRSTWRGLGGTWTGVARDGAGSADGRVLAVHQSRTLAEFNRDILKRSDNPVTRLTYLALGAESKAADATRDGATLSTGARAEQVIRQWLREKKINDNGLVLDNGAGLSRTERVTPAMLAAVLRVARESRWAPEFLAAMPIVGVDGGMRKRLADSAAVGVARIKTGGLRNVVSVAGFVPDVNGDPCIVVAILNHDDAKSAVGKPIVDALLEWVTRVDSRAILLTR